MEKENPVNKMARVHTGKLQKEKPAMMKRNTGHMRSPENPTG